jgi:hypothetical protein
MKKLIFKKRQTAKWSALTCKNAHEPIVQIRHLFGGLDNFVIR